jgi:hypothetical protein
LINKPKARCRLGHKNPPLDPALSQLNPIYTHPVSYSFTFHGFDPLAYSDPELTSGTMNYFRHFCRTPSTGDRPIARPLRKQDSTEKRGHTSMALAGFEPTIPMVQQFKTTRALDRAAIGIGSYCFKINFNIIFHLRGSFLSRLPAKSFYAFLIHSVHATCPIDLIFLDLNTPVISGKEYALRSYSLCKFLHSAAAASSLLGLNIPVITLFPKTFHYALP